MIEIAIFDWKRTLYNPENQDLIEGSEEVLQHLGSSGIKLFLVGKDPTGDMPDEIDRLGVTDYFTEINLVTNNKTLNDIGRFIDPKHPDRALIIGDRVRSEIEIGNRLGSQTVWIKNGKFAYESPETETQIPNYTLTTIAELPPLFDELRLG